MSRAQPPLLTYCLNVHPGETWAENRQAIETEARAVQARVAGERPFPLGLRLSAAAAASLAQPAELAAFRALLDEQRMQVFTINGFPYGPFHGRPVKQQVYRPDWRQPERLSYTLQLAEILAALLPEGVEGSISTVPGGYAADIDAAGEALVAAQLRACARELDAICQRTGRLIHLGLEPEPACLLETTEQTVAFMGRVLGDDPVARRHLGVCVDTCHVALQFESPAEALAAYARAGIRVSKVQLSAALACANEPDAWRALAAFDEPVYLHQTHVREEGVVHRYVDLPEGLGGLPRHAADAEVRVHFHVPLFWPGMPPLASTAATMDAAFWRQVVAQPSLHLEIETYTFDVFPKALRSRPLAESLTDEWRWVEAALARA
jgi:sugar phosphate isomerase/epimerase